MMIEVDNLSFAYSRQSKIFENFSWHVRKSEAWSIIGPSGCGKTTLLYLLAGLYEPNEGVIRIAGSTLKRPRPQTGLILQDHGLLPWATVRENARLGLKIRGFYGPDGRHAPSDAFIDTSAGNKIVDYWLKRLGINQLKDKYPSQLSGGQRQRTAISRSLMLDPDLLLLDEPFSALDAPTREDLEKLVSDLHIETGLTIIIVTHSIEESVLMGNKILALKAGTNHTPHIIENVLACRPDYRGSPDFHARCEELRSLLGRSA